MEVLFLVSIFALVSTAIGVIAFFWLRGARWKRALAALGIAAGSFLLLKQFLLAPVFAFIFKRM